MEVNGVRKLNYWRSNGWMTRRGKRVANVDLWEKVYLPSRCEVSLVSGTDVVFGNNIVQRNILRDAIRSSPITMTAHSSATPEVPAVPQPVPQPVPATPLPQKVNW